MIKGQGGIMGKERLLQLEEYIKVQQKVSPETLCEKFGVSMSTLRRDINTLEQMGCVQKAYYPFASRPRTIVDNVLK